MRSFQQSITLHGKVVKVDEKNRCFELQCRSGDQFPVSVAETTSFEVLTNIDNTNRDRIPNSSTSSLEKYVKLNSTLIVKGIYQENGEKRCLQGTNIILPDSNSERYAFESTHWWIDQIALMGDKWLDTLFDSTRSYKIDDFSKRYRTNSNILGGPSDDSIQECATLSRLVYGLASAYSLTGSERYLLAAEAGVKYQREAFRSLSHDGKYCFWAFGRRNGINGSKLVVASENDDDRGTIPLYEQIYALAGLAQYYRITLDWEVLEDIRRTINGFLDFYHDTEEFKANGFPGLGGYFSHIDYVTMRPDSESLAHNRARKNWNSIGDHIPAYLVNLLLALDPVPKGPGMNRLAEMRDVCRQILKETSSLIIEHFPDPESDFVNERFFADFAPDHSWRWQQNRAIIGHNLKISWNLSRVAFYYQNLATSAAGNERADYINHAEKCLSLARKLGDRMAEVGVDKLRGGVFDAVERKPSNGMPVEFCWGTTKDFWQQEQGILAFLILYGGEPTNSNWLSLARESEMFWNCFFLDRDHQGIFFRTNENGHPVVRGSYANKGGHSISGYHAFELNYLAHLYTRAYVNVEKGPDDQNFCLYFRVGADCQQQSLNVLPEFFPPGKIKIKSIRVNGLDWTEKLKPNSDSDFQIPLESVLRDVDIAVEFAAATE